MPLFGKKNQHHSLAGTTSGEAITSILDQEMHLTGELRFKGKARLDGTVEGNIIGDHLVLSESGQVHGDLELISLICHGTVKGNIKAQQVIAHRTASVHGNLVAASLSVEPGASLNGEITSSQQQAAVSGTSPRSEPIPEKEKS